MFSCRNRSFTSGLHFQPTPALSEPPIPAVSVATRACRTFFSAVTLVFPLFKKLSGKVSLQIFFSLGFCLLCGLGIEYLQTFVNRYFSITDLSLDLAGGLLALSALGLASELSLTGVPKRLLHLSATCVLVLCLLPMLIYLADETDMFLDFPELANFDGYFEAERWNGNSEEVKLLTPLGQSKVLQVSLSRARYSGAGLNYMIRDWRKFSVIKFEMFNPSEETLPLTFRIHDEEHYRRGTAAYTDRFNKAVILDSGWNLVSFPLTEVKQAPADRMMDLSAIQTLGFFSTRLPKPRVVYLKSVTLE